MSQHDNKILIQAAIQIWDTKDFSKLHEIYDENCIHHQQRHHENVTFTGIQAWQKFIKQFLHQHPNYQEKIIFQLAEDNKVVSLLDCQTANISWSGVVIDRIELGKIQETWAWFKRI